MTTPDLVERLRGLIERLDRSGDCWLWTGKTDERGRGRVWRDGKLKLHHRAVWEALFGPIPTGAMLCHHCDNPRCANPDHLYVGDGKTNVADMFDRKRHWTQVEPLRARAIGAANGRQNTWTRGARNPKAKLSKEAVALIRESNDGPRALAKQLGVHRTTIQRIKKGALWV
ncbi:HNH endonuclease [Hoeflea sp. 108]|uniref:HNH endonuclease n=1 Tax=Hoeflea sp. 108 TaxID=1116369 RepID=UPI000366C331|nr:HNH endonuclease [Hoeflea sp. 108]